MSKALGSTPSTAKKKLFIEKQMQIALKHIKNLPTLAYNVKYGNLSYIEKYKLYFKIYFIFEI
jgi:hypothetical protein